MALAISEQSAGFCTSPPSRTSPAILLAALETAPLSFQLCRHCEVVWCQHKNIYRRACWQKQEVDSAQKKVNCRSFIQLQCISYHRNDSQNTSINFFSRHSAFCGYKDVRVKKRKNPLKRSRPKKRLSPNSNRRGHFDHPLLGSRVTSNPTPTLSN